MKIFDRLQFIIGKGWSVFPVVAGDKIPAIGGGFRSAKGGAEAYPLFRGKGEDINIGIALGASGLFAVDIEVARHEWVERLPATFTQRTPSGGWHFVYRQPVERMIPNVPLSVGLAPDVEIRGDGGYILAPGSMVSAKKSKTGEPGEYEIVEDMEPVEAPAWLLDRIDECKAKAKEITKPKLQIVRASTTSGEQWRQRVDDLVNTLVSAEPGTRNDTLYRVANSVGRVVGGGYLSEGEACGILQSAISDWASPMKNADAIERGVRHGTSLEPWYPDVEDDPLGDQTIDMILQSAQDAPQREPEPEPTVSRDMQREALVERLAALSDTCADFVQLARDCSVYWQPGFALGGAVALGSVLGSRRLVWPSQSPLTSSCYVLIVGGSGQGKSTAKDPVMRCLSSWPELIGASKLGPSVQSNIASIKASSESGHGQLWILDEWHDALESMLSKKASTFTSENKGLILEMATMNTGTYRRRKSVMGSQDGEDHDVIHVPGFCMLALSATEPLMRVMGQASVDNGLIPRHIAFGPQSSLPRKIRAARAVDTPDRLRSAIVEQGKIHKAWTVACTGLELWQGVNVDVQANARRIIEAYGDRVDDERRAKRGGIPDAILARAEEHAIRVSMCLATLAQAGETATPSITENIARLACDIVEMSISELGQALRDHGGETDYERGLNKLKKAIGRKARADGWAMWSDVLSLCRWTDAKTLSSMQMHLAAMGDVEAESKDTKGVGRTPLRLRLR